MKLHKFFSLKRFCRLLSADLRLNSKRYLYTIIGGAIGIYLFLLFGMLINENYTIGYVYYNGLFTFSLMALGLFVGSAFPAFSEKPATANFLLFPASHFEKLLTQFLLYYVAGAIIFVFVFWVDAHLARLSLLNLEDVRTGKWVIVPFSYGNIFQTFAFKKIEYFCHFLIIIFSSGGFLFTTRLFFRRFALVKSIISGVILFLSTSVFLVLFSHLFYPEITKGFNIAPIEYSGLWGVSNYLLLVDSLFAIILIFFLPLAYFKLKEKQV